MDLKLVLLSAVLQLGTSYPVAGFPLQYETGKTFKYSYSTETVLNVPNPSPKTQKGVGFKFSAIIELNPVWAGTDKMLVRLQIARPKIHSVARPDVARELQGLPRQPVFFTWQGGKVSHVLASEDDSTLAINIKKGVISLFQIKVDDGKHTEVDASGECTVSYTKSGSTITRKKSNCQSVDTTGQYTTSNPLMSVARTSESETVYTIKDDLITQAKSSEKHQVTLRIQQTVSSVVSMVQNIKLENASRGTVIKASSIEEAIENIKKKQKLYGMVLDTTHEITQCTADSLALSDRVSQHRERLQVTNMASTDAAFSFLDLVSALRACNKDSVLQILTDKNNEDIIGALLDATAAAQTTATQTALMEALQFDDSYYIDNPERYILAAAFSTHPTEELLRDLLNLYQKDIPSEKLYESIGEALGAIVYTYCTKHQPCQSKLVKEILKTFLENAERCEKPGCQAMAIRALSNAGVPDTIPALLKYAESCKEMVVCEAAIKALRRMGKEQMNKEVKAVMRRIFLQKNQGYDSAVRTRALNILLENEPTQEDITAILGETRDPYNTEYDVYVQARVFNLMEDNHTIQSMVKETLKDGNISNYHILAPKGKSLAFTGTMAEGSGFLATDFMYLENSKSGIIKRSGMDVLAQGSNQTMLVYGFTMFAAGLEGLLGEEVEAGQEDVTATAGMALDLMDVSLRPLTFFEGSGGLMSAVWSAPSELTSALQVNILLTDHLERLHLQNGLIVEIDIQGALSLDLSGSLSVSLWNKNSKSLVANSAAVAIQASTSIVTSPFKAGIKMTNDASSAINFRTDVDFYDGIKMCMQMERPQAVSRQNVTRFEHARGFKKGYVAKTNRSNKIMAVSYPLPRPNSKMCKILLGNS